LFKFMNGANVAHKINAIEGNAARLASEP
jgi:hypothetical protein